jgi:two-component system, NtrC family, nitrogen regulation response regulator GlnG
MAIQVLIAEADTELRDVVCRFLRRRGYKVRSTSDGVRALRLLRRDEHDVAVFDVGMPGVSGAKALAANAGRATPRPLIAVTAEEAIYEAVAALRSGAFETLTRPFRLEHLEWLIQRAAAAPAPSEGERHILYDGPGGSGKPLFGFSSPMREVVRAVSRAALVGSPMLLVGEDGTGKELVARVLHQASRRREGPFISFHPRAVAPDDVSARLFDDEGLLVRASGGTLYIDEVTRLDREVQERLVRLLRVGTSEGEGDPSVPDVRLMSSTKLDLMSRVRRGTMSSEFYWYLRALTVRVPPLRERREDILPLARWVLAREARNAGMPQPLLAPEAMHWMQGHRWPGNVRELEGTLTRGMTASSGRVVQLADLAGPSRRLDHGVDDAPAESFEDLLLNRLRPVVRAFAPGPDGSDLHRLVKDTAEKAVITLAMERTGGNQLQAARLLGINRNTLRTKIEQLRIPTRFVRRGGRS